MLYPTITITKFEAARRQLRTAIELWFRDGDPVSIHALAFSSHEIIHSINAHKKAGELIFNSSRVKPEYRRQVNEALKKSAVFFKHARKDPDPNGSIEFRPRLSEGFMLFSLLGIEQIGEKLNGPEAAFLAWRSIHNPTIFRKDVFKDGIPVETKNQIRGWSKSEFLESFLGARRDAGLTT